MAIATWGERGIDNFSGVTSDTYIRATQPTNNYGGHTAIQASSNASSGKFRGLVKFDLSALSSFITDSTAITYARLYMKTLGISGVTTVDAHRVLRDWGEGIGGFSSPATSGEATWNSAKHLVDDWGTAGCDNTTNDRLAEITDSQITSVIQTYYVWDVTDDVKAFFDGASNYGWNLRDTTETGSEFVSFHSSENVTALNRPYLEIDLAGVSFSSSSASSSSSSSTSAESVSSSSSSKSSSSSSSSSLSSSSVSFSSSSKSSSSLSTSSSSSSYSMHLDERVTELGPWNEQDTYESQPFFYQPQVGGNNRVIVVIGSASDAGSGAGVFQTVNRVEIGGVPNAAFGILDGIYGSVFSRHYIYWIAFFLEVQIASMVSPWEVETIWNSVPPDGQMKIAAMTYKNMEQIGNPTSDGASGTGDGETIVTFEGLNLKRGGLALWHMLNNSGGFSHSEPVLWTKKVEMTSFPTAPVNFVGQTIASQESQSKEFSITSYGFFTGAESEDAPQGRLLIRAFAFDPASYSSTSASSTSNSLSSSSLSSSSLSSSSSSLSLSSSSSSLSSSSSSSSSSSLSSSSSSSSISSSSTSSSSSYTIFGGDTYITIGNGVLEQHNFGNESHLLVGGIGSASSNILIRFSTSFLLDGVTKVIDIEGAILNLRVVTNELTTNTKYNLYQVKKSWGAGRSNGGMPSRGDASWIYARTGIEKWEKPGAIGASDITMISSYTVTANTTEWMTFDITDYVQSIYLGTPNRGVMLSFGSGDKEHKIEIASLEYPELGDRPFMEMDISVSSSSSSKSSSSSSSSLSSSSSSSNSSSSSSSSRSSSSSSSSNSEVWSSYFDNTKWSGLNNTTWSGTQWDSWDGGPGGHILWIEDISTWTSGYRPSKVRLTFNTTGYTLFGLTIQDSNGDFILNISDPVSGEEYDLTFGSFDIDELILNRFGAAIGLTNIEFLEP
jgi:hypothetical protein